MVPVLTSVEGWVEVEMFGKLKEAFERQTTRIRGGNDMRRAEWEALPVTFAPSLLAKFRLDLRRSDKTGAFAMNVPRNYYRVPHGLVTIGS